MKITSLIILAGVGVAGVLLFRNYRQSSPKPSGSSPEQSPLAPVVESVLHQHEGEDSPMVHAFEQALEEERRHEENLAHDVGVRA